MTRTLDCDLFSLTGTSWTGIYGKSTCSLPAKTVFCKHPRLIDLGDEENALSTLFSHSRKARTALAGMIARQLVESPLARGRVMSDPDINASLETPFQHSQDILGPLARAFEMTEGQVAGHLAEHANPRFFTRLFKLFAPCETHIMIAAGWSNSSHHDGFRFRRPDGNAECWVPTAWVRRNQVRTEPAPACKP